MVQSTKMAPAVKDRHIARLVAYLTVGVLSVFAVYRVEREADERTRDVAREAEARIYQDCISRQATRQALRDVIAAVIAEHQPNDPLLARIAADVDGPSAPLGPIDCEALHV